MFKWLKKIFQGKKSTEYFHNVVEVEEQPEELVPKGTLLLVTGGGRPKWLKFSCPCGCGSEHSLPLMANRTPHWEITGHGDGRISVYPSVDVASPECGAHFWIKRNRVVWAEPVPNKKLKRS